MTTAAKPSGIAATAKAMDSRTASIHLSMLEPFPLERIQITSITKTATTIAKVKIPKNLDNLDNTF